MKRLAEFVGRLWKRSLYSQETTIKRILFGNDISDIILITTDFLKINNSYMVNDTYVRLYNYFNELLKKDNAAVFIVYQDNTPVGMVCCGIIDSNPWDDRVTGSVWFLYTKENCNIRYVETLIRESVTFLLSKGMEVCLVDTPNPRLADAYVRMMGFEMTHVTYQLESRN